MRLHHMYLAFSAALTFDMTPSPICMLVELLAGPEPRRAH